MAVTTEINYSKSIKRESSIKKFVRGVLLPAPANRYFNWGRNVKLSKCIGIIGPRGSCKSLSAAAISVMDGFVPGYKVVSNMGIRWGIKLGDYAVGYSSQDLDKAALLNFDIESNLFIVTDEVNIEFSEARRSMTNRNLIFDKIIQQLRKRSLNVIYTVQHEMWIDNRLRWQTDIFIKCKDICLKPGGLHLPFDFGEFADWRIYDMTGIFGHGAYQDTGRPLVDECRFHGKQWWGTYDTNQIIGGDEIQYGSMDIKRTKEAEDWDWLVEAITNLCTSNTSSLNNNGEISEIDLMYYLNVEPSQYRYVGNYLNKHLGIMTKYSSGQKIFMFKYWIDKAEREKVIN